MQISGIDLIEANNFTYPYVSTQSEGVQNEEVWKPVLVDLARQAASLISPQQSIQKGVFDPRQHVKVQ